MSNHKEIMIFALKEITRLREQENEALKKTHQKELVALKNAFEGEKRKMEMDIIDLKKMADIMEDQLVILDDEGFKKDEQINRQKERIEFLQQQATDYRCSVAIQQERELQYQQEVENLKYRITDLECRMEHEVEEKLKQKLMNYEFELELFRNGLSQQDFDAKKTPKL